MALKIGLALTDEGRNRENKRFQINSFLILLSSLTNAFFGFLFWVIAARLYPQSEIGIASGLISALALGFTFSRLGLDQSIVKFFPQGDKKSILMTSSIIVLASSLIIGVILIALSPIWLSQAEFSFGTSIAFILFLMAISLAWLLGRSFIAVRKNSHYFIQILISNSKVLFILFLTSLGAFGIFFSYGLAFAVAIIFSLIFLLRLLGSGQYSFDRSYLRKSFAFSSGTYVYGFFMLLPMQVLPLLVLNDMGTNEAAIYYLVYAFTSLLFVIPDAFGTTLFVEGSHGRPLGHLYKKSAITIVTLLVLVVVFYSLFGKQILGIIGDEYVGGFQLLQIMALSSFLVAVVIVYYSHLLVNGRVKLLILLSVITSVIQIGTSYLLIGTFGILGVGYSWLICYLIMSAIVGVLIVRERRRDHVHI